MLARASLRVRVMAAAALLVAVTSLLMGLLDRARQEHAAADTRRPGPAHVRQRHARRPQRIHASRRRALAAQSLVDVGLGDRLRHLPSELSGGQQQRVAIARALVKQPSVLLADEPTGNLDEGTRDETIALLEKLWKDLGLTMVLVTHDTPLPGGRSGWA